MLFDVLAPAASLDAGPRAIAAGVTAFGVALLLGPPIIRWLRQRKFRDGACRKASDTLATIHAQEGKAATPTMGGLVLLASFSVSLLVWAPLSQPALFVGLGLVFAFAGIGAVDDWAKLHGAASARGRDGLRGRSKLLAEVALALATVLALAALAEVRTEVGVPLVGLTVSLGVWYLPFAAFVIVGAANAANLTDGLDGLASGVVGVAATALAAAALVAAVAAMVWMAPAPAARAATEPAGFALFATALAGSCFGFLWHNRYPARVFMGDTGSLAIGAGLGFAAVLLRLEAVLLIVGGVLVLEALSVMLQVASFKLTGKRVFRCAPIHHHFQFLGWHETKVVARFWLAGLLLAVLGVASHVAYAA